MLDIKIDLGPILDSKDLSRYSILKEYLGLSNHGTLQKRHIKRAGEFFFYDLASQDDISFDSSEISIFRGGPQIRDFFFHLLEDGTSLKALVRKSVIHPDKLSDYIKEVLGVLGQTAEERLPGLKRKATFPPTVPFGYSLWAKNGAKKTVQNFKMAVKEEVFSKDHRDFCETRNFCLMYRERREV